MKINEFKKALYKALELKIYIDKNDFGDLQNTPKNPASCSDTNGGLG